MIQRGWMRPARKPKPVIRIEPSAAESIANLCIQGEMVASQIVVVEEGTLIASISGKRFLVELKVFEVE